MRKNEKYKNKPIIIPYIGKKSMKLNIKSSCDYAGGFYISGVIINSDRDGCATTCQLNSQEDPFNEK